MLPAKGAEPIEAAVCRIVPAGSQVLLLRCRVKVFAAVTEAG